MPDSYRGDCIRGQRNVAADPEKTFVRTISFSQSCHSGLSPEIRRRIGIFAPLDSAVRSATRTSAETPGEVVDTIGRALQHVLKERPLA